MRRKIKISYYIKDHRVKRDITQEQLAEKMGLSVRHLRTIENGEVDLTFRQLAEVADYLDTPFLNLFSVNHVPPINPFKPMHIYN